MTEVERSTPVDAWAMLLLGSLAAIWTAMLTAVVYVAHARALTRG